jgi:hypothetical protein
MYEENKNNWNFRQIFQQWSSRTKSRWISEATLNNRSYQQDILWIFKSWRKFWRDQSFAEINPDFRRSSPLKNHCDLLEKGLFLVRNNFCLRFPHFEWMNGIIRPVFRFPICYCHPFSFTTQTKSMYSYSQSQCESFRLNYISRCFLTEPYSD